VFSIPLDPTIGLDVAGLPDAATAIDDNMQEQFQSGRVVRIGAGGECSLSGMQCFGTSGASIANYAEVNCTSEYPHARCNKYACPK
jgi:hypothetical protein